MCMQPAVKFPHHPFLVDVDPDSAYRGGPEAGLLQSGSMGGSCHGFEDYTDLSPTLRSSEAS